MCGTSIADLTPNDLGFGNGLAPSSRTEAPPAIHLANDLSRTLATLIDVLQMTLGIWFWWGLVDAAQRWADISIRSVVMWDTSLSVWLKVLGVILMLCGPAILDAYGGSLGKRMLKIQVLTRNGRTPSLGMSMVRHLFKYVIHMLLPLLWKLIEFRVTGGRHLHDVVASTVVIERPPEGDHTSAKGDLLHEQLLAQMNSHRMGRAQHTIDHKDLAAAQEKTTLASRVFDSFRNGLALLIGAGLLWVFGEAIWSLYQESQHPITSAVTQAKDASQPLTQLLTQRFEQGQSMELDWNNPELKELETQMGTVFNSVYTQARGPVVLQIRKGSIAGKHIVWVPEFNITQKRIKKWQCGSPDIESNLLPTGCKAQLPNTHEPAK